MANGLVGENLFLLYSLIMGVFITFVYDLLRIFRRVIRHGILAISLEDICFWVFCGISVFYVMHTESNGTLRWFAVLGALCGMLLYKGTVSSILVKYVSLGINKVMEIIGKVLTFVCTPFCFAGKKGVQAAHHTANAGKRIWVYIKKRLTGFLKMLKMILCKQ